MRCNSRQPDAAQSLSPLFSSPVSSLNSLSLSIAVLELFTAHTSRYADLELLWEVGYHGINICTNLSEIDHSAAELLTINDRFFVRY